MLSQTLVRLLDFIGYVLVWTSSLIMIITGAVHYSKTGNDTLLFYPCAWMAVVMYYKGFFKRSEDE